MTTSKISPRQERAIESLLTGRSKTAVANASGISVSTLDRWLQDPDFSQAYRVASERLSSMTCDGLLAASQTAIDCLLRNTSCGNPAAEVRSAVAILDLGLRYRSFVDLEARVQMLERENGEVAAAR